MRVGLNLLYLLPGVVGGTQTYAEELIAALIELDDDTEYVAYVNREAHRGGPGSLRLPDDPRLRLVGCEVDAVSRMRRYAFEQLRLPSLVRRDGVDVLHSLGYVAPLRLACPSVVTIHDLIYVGFAAAMSPARRVALRVFVRGSAHRAERVITVSAASRRQLLDDVDLDPGRVVVVHEAPRSRSRTGPDDGDPTPESGEVLSRLGVRPPFVMAFGSVSPTKNLPRLVRAFARADPDGESRLVLVGHLPPDGEVRAVVEHEGLGDRVVCTGYLADGDVAALLGSARVFAFPSLYEGFGLPVLDAQQAGVPVVSSDRASLPEVAGEGALFVRPTSVPELADALRAVLTDRELAARLVAAGRGNVERFSWSRAAAETLDVYRSAARDPGAGR